MMTRRGFFGLVAGLVAAPIAAKLGRDKRYQPLLWGVMQHETPSSWHIVYGGVHYFFIDARGDA